VEAPIAQMDIGEENIIEVEVQPSTKVQVAMSNPQRCRRWHKHN
jgi:hypothetical protein